MVVSHCRVGRLIPSGAHVATFPIVVASIVITSVAAAIVVVVFIRGRLDFFIPQVIELCEREPSCFRGTFLVLLVSTKPVYPQVWFQVVGDCWVFQGPKPRIRTIHMLVNAHVGEGVFQKFRFGFASASSPTRALDKGEFANDVRARVGTAYY